MSRSRIRGSAIMARCRGWLFLLVAALTSCCMQVANPQLLINVRNQGGDVMQESISANVSDDAVLLEFLRPDGIFITQLIDFTNEVQVLKAIVPGEEELGQSELQVMCFLVHADKTEFIAADAMVKLRQKNPGTIRTAEEDKGSVSVRMSAWAGSGVRSLSPHAARLCADAGRALYTSHAYLAEWSARRGMESSWLLSAVTPFPDAAISDNSADKKPVSSCAAERNLKKDCVCHFEACVSWYPCGLKYCKGKPQANVPVQNLSYRCGIKTCRKCQRFEYYVHRKQNCLWDE